MRKSEIRQALKDFFKNLSTLPKNKIEKQFVIWYRGIWLGFITFLIYLLREGVIVLVALGLILLWFIYEISKGK